MPKWLLLSLCFLLLIAFFAVGVGVSGRQFEASGRIARNVSIAGFDVSGRTAQQAVEVLHRKWVPTLPGKIVLHAADKEWAVPPGLLGSRLLLEDAVARALRVGREGPLWDRTLARLGLSGPRNLEAACEVDESRVQEFLIEIAPQVNREPKNATVEIEGNEVHITPGVEGRVLEIEASRLGLCKALRNPNLQAFELKVDIQRPAVSEEELADIQVVLGTYTTPFNAGNKDRSHNLRLATEMLSGTVIPPGAELSVNAIVGPRLTEKGYRSAPIFVNGEVEPQTGGGVCQVATTLYNAALLANLQVLERHHHSRPVHYAPAGRDATVYYGQLDMRFKNTLSHALMVMGEVKAAKLTFWILGHREDQAKVSLRRTNLVTLPYARKEFLDPSLAAGTEKVEVKGRYGKKVTLWRIVTTRSGDRQEQRLHTDTYRPQNEIVKVGPPAPETSPPTPSILPTALPRLNRGAANSSEGAP